MRIAKSEIRPVGTEDIAQMVFVIRNSFRDVAKRFGLTEENCPTHPSNCKAETVKKDMERGVRFFFKIDHGIPAGCMGLEQSENEQVFYLTRLGVLPGRRSRGFGKALVDRAIREAQSAGAKQVSVAIIAQDEPLKKWYADLGFEEKETKKFDHLPFQVTFMNRSI